MVLTGTALPQHEGRLRRLFDGLPDFVLLDMVAAHAVSQGRNGLLRNIAKLGSQLKAEPLHRRPRGEA